jgi:hypothetical protein
MNTLILSAKQRADASSGINDADEVTFGDGVGCFIVGCCLHVKHPCEMCGRYQARGEAKVRTGFLIVKQEEEVSTSG